MYAYNSVKNKSQIIKIKIAAVFTKILLRIILLIKNLLV